MKITRKGYYTISKDGVLLTKEDGSKLQVTSRDEAYERITEGNRDGLYTIHCPNRDVMMSLEQISEPTPDPGPGPEPEPGPDPVPEPPTGLAQTSILAKGSPLTKRNISWIFDVDVETGQFATGDKFVIDPGSGFNIDSVTPESSVDGTHLNPVADGEQGLHSGALNYNASLRASFPLFVSSGDALISSIDGNSPAYKFWNNDRHSSNTDVGEAEVLTILASIPFADQLRPSPCDRSQKLYRTSQIDSSILSNKNTSGIDPLETRNGYVGIDYHLRGMERPWILYGSDWQARSIHAYDNMLGYHQQVGEFLSETMCVLVSDLVTDTLIERFCQVTIDYYHTRRDSAFWSAPLVLGGLLLNVSDIYNHWVDTGEGNDRDREKFFIAGDGSSKDIGYDIKYQSSIIAENQTWYGWTHPTMGNVPMFSKQTSASGTNNYMEHLHPSEWDLPGSDHEKSEVYRSQHDVHPNVGMLLAMRLVDDFANNGAITKTDNIAAFDYIDFWMDFEFNKPSNFYLGTSQTYYDYMQTQTGGFTIYNKNYQSGGSAFINGMWANYRGII